MMMKRTSFEMIFNGSSVSEISRPLEPPHHTMPVYLTRHGTSEWNLLKKWQGEVDTNLAPKGVAQAEERAQWFASKGMVFDAAYSSDLKRAAQTAEILAAACGGAAVALDRRLRECSLGEFEGQTKAEIYGPKYAPLWARLRTMPHEERIRTAYFEGLEPPIETGIRAMECLKEAAER